MQRSNRIWFPVLLLVLTAVLASAAAVSAQVVPHYQYPGSKYIISPQELKALLGSEDVKIYDFQGVDEYAVAHVPGAMNFDTTLLITEERFAYEFNGVENAEAVFAAAGIERDDTVVFYWGDDRSEATYAFWALNYLGHPDVRILNGGIAGWKALGYETTGGFEEYPVSDFRAEVRDGEYAGLEFVRENLANPDFDFVDARGLGAYNQAHLPVTNDYHLHIERLFEGDLGLLKSPEEIHAILAEVGLSPDRAIVAYCTRGRLASQLYWALKVLGHENVRNFEASMMGWEAAGLPVASAGN